MDREATSTCFHCGEPLPSGEVLLARCNGNDEPVCCHGCKAVAEFIHSSGFGSFYQHRDSPLPGSGLRVEIGDWDVYDSTELQQRFVHRRAGVAEATVIIGGIYCSACVWLLDNGLRQLTAIESVSINPTSRRAVIVWDPETLSFAELLASIEALGFTPSPVALGQDDASQLNEQRRALRRLVVAVAAGMQVMTFAVALYAGDYYGIDAAMQQFFRVLSLIVCTPIVIYSAQSFFVGAMRGLRAGKLGMDVPVSLAIATAFVASAWAAIVNQGEVYFDSVAMFVVLLSATRYLEMRARHRADDYTVALARLLPETVTRLTDGTAAVVPASHVAVGDELLLRPGDVVPVDGRLKSGELMLDESMLTGEALPVRRGVDAEVHAGAINCDGSGSILVTQVGANTSLAEIGRLIDRAKADRPPIAALADRIAARFVIAVLTIAALAGTVWLQLAPERAFEVVLATLVVTCPCALALATPAALAAATSRLAHNGFLLIRSRVLQVLARASVFVFDKTGTLTRGQPALLGVDRLVAEDCPIEDYLAVAATLEMASEHVLARAFRPYLPRLKLNATDVKIVMGAGIEADVAGVGYRLGNLEFASSRSADGSLPPLNGEEIAVYLAREDVLVARFRIGDELREDAPEALQALEALGFRIVLASGDGQRAVAAVAERLGIDDWHASLSPRDKRKLVNELRAAGETVVMVGDGINDAPVLKSADASIAIDAGTALARASADAVAMGKRLVTIVEAVTAARNTQRVIRQNITWAIGYNLIAVPLAVSGLLVPWLAALGMSLSSAAVVGNALRLRRSAPSVRVAAGEGAVKAERLERGAAIP